MNTENSGWGPGIPQWAKIQSYIFVPFISLPSSSALVSEWPLRDLVKIQVCFGNHVHSPCTNGTQNANARITTIPSGASAYIETGTWNSQITFACQHPRWLSARGEHLSFKKQLEKQPIVIGVSSHQDLDGARPLVVSIWIIASENMDTYLKAHLYLVGPLRCIRSGAQN